MKIFEISEQDFSRIIQNAVAAGITNSKKPALSEKSLIRGIGGLADFLGISKPRAQRLKNEGVLSCFQQDGLVIFNSETVLSELSAYNQLNETINKRE